MQGVRGAELRIQREGSHGAKMTHTWRYSRSPRNELGCLQCAPHLPYDTGAGRCPLPLTPSSPTHPRRCHLHVPPGCSAPQLPLFTPPTLTPPLLMFPLRSVFHQDVVVRSQLPLDLQCRANCRLHVVLAASRWGMFRGLPPFRHRHGRCFRLLTIGGPLPASHLAGSYAGARGR